MYIYPVSIWFLCFYFCSICKHLKQSNVVNTEYTPVLIQGNVIHSNFPPQSFQSYQAAVNYFLFARELIDFNIAKLNFLLLHYVKSLQNCFQQKWILNCTNSTVQGHLLQLLQGLFRYNYSPSYNGAGFREFVNAFEVSKNICMAELQFELLVLRSSFYIKQITAVAACCHHAHDNPEVLTVTHA